MEREEAIKKLKKLEGSDLIKVAKDFDVTIWRNKRLNKGWAGHTIERYLGLPINSSQAPNFGSWELKIVPLKLNKHGNLVVKETMAITMIDPVNVLQKPFKESHLLAKLQKAVICARVFESKAEKSSVLARVTRFDLDDKRLYSLIERDYEETRKVIGDSGFDKLSGRMGKVVQPRTKGPGHGSRSRAFYARKDLVAHILGLRDLFDEDK